MFGLVGLVWRIFGWVGLEAGVWMDLYTVCVSLGGFGWIWVGWE